ncbi:MAG: NotI family restriction endonuclease [Acidimicrobiaceae bacterium]|nr:NotI family restriction endonuclease [Acidimicrobiaceae bacterium]
MPDDVKTRYGIAEWYGKDFTSLNASQREDFAKQALGETDAEPPRCPFQPTQPPCSKRGGVCSIQRYKEGENSRIGARLDSPVITCPRRFEESGLINKWLAETAGFPLDETEVASEVPFMRSTETEKPAGKIDMIVAHVAGDSMTWHGLEIQAVYFSGTGMTSEFEALRDDNNDPPPYPTAVRRPDWRSSSAKRLMPQLEIKAPTLRRWGAKIAVAVDRPFFEAVGGASAQHSHDLNEGDIIWLVARLKRTPPGTWELIRDHWEVLTLEDSKMRLQAAETVSREHFEEALKSRFRPL